MSFLVPVGADTLVVTDLLGSIMMPTGAIQGGQTPQQASQDVLRGAPDVLAWVQTRRRKVITHVLATTEPMTREDVGHLIYRDPRADVRVPPTMSVVDGLPAKGRLRLLVGLQALATGEMAYIEGDVVRPSAPPDLIPE
ncbi:hypothetical protein AB0I10_39225 [Streptomyces sp. NPDC050636]|uniref:hypothetical protein n=1 Tax=Streptomyces sp. NPDC050636 TaxID=3154510 RepID=UPI003425ED51